MLRSGLIRAFNSGNFAEFFSQITGHFGTFGGAFYSLTARELPTTIAANMRVELRWLQYRSDLNQERKTS
jgi:hypothetical protein